MRSSTWAFSEGVIVSYSGGYFGGVKSWEYSGLGFSKSLGYPAVRSNGVIVVCCQSMMDLTWNVSGQMKTLLGVRSVYSQLTDA